MTRNTSAGAGAASSGAPKHSQPFTSTDAQDAVFAFDLLRRIEEAPDGLSPRELATEFEGQRSLGDIRRGIDCLQRAGFPVERKDGRWYCDTADDEESGIGLTPSEVLSLLLGEEEDATADLASVRERLRQRLEARLTPEGRSWLTRLRVGLIQQTSDQSGERPARQYPFCNLRGSVHDYVVELEPQVAHLATDHVWHPSQRVHRLGNGGVYITFRAAGLVEVAAWIGSMGGQAQAIAPIELVGAVIELHCRGIERHRAGNVHMGDLQIPGLPTRPPTSGVLAKTGRSMAAHAILPKLRSGT